MPLAANVTVDSTTWAALALVLTVIGATLSWVAWRRRGLAAGLRGLAWTLVPVAAWLTGTLKLAANILDDVINWATRLVFSPTVWLGIVVAGAAVVLWVVSGALRSRGIGTRGRVRAPGGAKQVPAAQSDGQSGGRSGAQPAAPSGRKPPKRKAKDDDDMDDMDDIEAILKRHGI
jgi:hypothetical protein